MTIRRILTTLLLIILLPVSIAAVLIGYSYLTYPRIMLAESHAPNKQNSNTLSATNPVITNADYYFWVGEKGPSGPLFSGPQQYPFICTTLFYKMGQTIVDNNNGEGSAVFPELFSYPLSWLPPVGYSKHCSMFTRIDYFYFSSKANEFVLMPNHASRPNDLVYIPIGKEKLPFIVRVERGTINRFIYSIAMLAPHEESTKDPKLINKSAWNGKLVYKFQGGVGIGRFQGKFTINKKQSLNEDALKRGYAVAYSSGTRTSSHYNL